MPASRRSTLKLVAAATALAVARPVFAAGQPTWASEHFRDHKLVGKLFGQTGPADISLDELKQRCVKAPYVMLGEIHPNPDHHTLQAQFLRHMVSAGRKPAVVFEMLTRAQQPVIDAFVANPSAGLDALAQRLEWKRSGWPDFALYKPLFEVALEAGLKIRAGNLEKSTVRRLGGRIGSRLTAAERAGFGLDKPLPAQTATAMLATIKTAHCNLLPDTVLPLMRDIQRARDHVMAEAMLTSGSADGAVLICGSGHARLDWGAGYLVEKAAPGKLISIAFSEAYEGASEADFVDSAHHFTYVTPKQDITDHCAAFKKRRKHKP